MHIALPIIAGVFAIAAAIWAWRATRKVHALRQRLEFGAVRYTELIQRNRRLSEKLTEHELRQTQDAERRSAAVSKGNRTRAIKRADRIAATTQNLAEGR